MDRYEVMAGKMAPLTDGAHRKWGFAGKVETIFGWLIIHAMSPVQPKFAKEIAQTERRTR